jgi:protein ImuB
VRARPGPARYFGGEAAAATVLAGAIAALGIDDVRVGIADGTFTAEQAARSGTRREDPVRIVPAGTAADFLALPVVVLDEELASLFGRLGVQTVGEVAALGADRLVERFGTRGQWLYALSSGRDPRPVTARTPPPELHREVAFEPPVETADQIAFALRVPAAEFVSRLGAQGLVCTELRVVLTGDRGERSERVWLHPGAFDAAAVVDRVRWQLAEQSPAGEERCAAESPARTAAQRGRCGSNPRRWMPPPTTPPVCSGRDPRSACTALSRVQAMLGHQGVLTPAVGGGAG